MNDYARRIMRDRRMRREDRNMEMSRDGHHGEYEGSYRGTYERDHRRDYDSNDMRRGEDYRRDRGEDYRRDRGDMRSDYGENYRRDYGEDYRDRGGYPRNERGQFKDRRGRDYGEDYRRRDYDDMRRDYGENEEQKLDRQTMREWGEMLKNADGSNGSHFEKKQIEDVAKTIGVKYDEYTPDELVMVANMLYSDYCEALRHYIPKDIEKEAMAYVKLAHAWLADEDAPKGSEKLALYYYCIIEQDDE